jgi:CBS domain-containing protein
MAQLIREAMTADPVCVPASTPLTELASRMREHDIGDVVVADGKDPATTKANDICSGQVLSVAPDDPVSRAVALMRAHAVRRVLVCDGDRPVGIVSLGDLAVERDPTSALADISASPPNA